MYLQRKRNTFCSVYSFKQNEYYLSESCGWRVQDIINGIPCTTDSRYARGILDIWFIPFHQNEDVSRST
jgi:hypothetical protein